jgi:hypothetical protein
MSTPIEYIQAFLGDDKPCQAQRLEVAIVFALAMLRELRSSVDEWEAALESLKAARRHAIIQSN